jgi:hypothetical protein
VYKDDNFGTAGTYNSVLDELKVKKGIATTLVTTSSKKELHQNPAIEELLTTEKTYNAELTRLALVLGSKFVKTENFLRKFCEPVVELKDLSDRLLKNINSAIDGDISERERGILREDRPRLIERFFKVLVTYALLYDEFCKIQKNAPDFQEIEGELKRLSNGLGLLPHLITPIQRGPRYKLLISEIQKLNTSLEDTHRSECDEVVKTLSTNLTKVNSAMEKKEPEKTGYQFGDVSRFLYAKIVGTEPETKAEPTQTKNDSKPYRFGDYTREFFAGFQEGLAGEKEEFDECEATIDSAQRYFQ